MSDEEDSIAEAPPASPGEEEDSPVAAMEVGDDFRDYFSVLSHPERTPPTRRHSQAFVRHRRTAPRQTSETFGILDLQPDGLVIPPVFREPETLQAMRRLGYVPEDLTMMTSIGFHSDNIDIRNKVLRELDRRRMRMVENLIAERNRIANGEPPPHAARKRPRKKRPRRKRGRESRLEDVSQQRLEANLAHRERAVAQLLQKEEHRLDIAKKMLENKAIQASKARQARQARQAKVAERRMQLDIERIAKAQNRIRELDIERIAKAQNRIRELDRNPIAKAQKRLRELDKIQQRIEKLKAEKVATSWTGKPQRNRMRRGR
jgi:hypothetical protein